MKQSWRDIFRNQKTIRVFLAMGGIFGLTCLLVIVMNFRGVTVDAPTANEVPQETPVIRDPFTGEAIDQASEGSRVACVMVENSADAWPLSGIENAFLVIEAPVEGSIPRFMACFTEGVDVEKIGPVRSARPYYVSWASGFQHALYAHVGGSPEVLEILAASKDVIDLNEFWNGFSFWRDGARYAPHNSYTSSNLLWAAADRLGASSVVSPGWVYENPEYEIGKKPCDDVVVDWASAPIYGFTWSCDKETGTYIRYQGSAVMNTAQKSYDASNVIIMEVSITSIDEVDRRHIVTEGMGNARVCSQGRCRDAVWHKEGINKPLQFFVSYPDKPMVFAPGKTWIEVVEDLGAVQVGDKIE